MSNYDQDEQRRQGRIEDRVSALFVRFEKELDKDAKDPNVSDNLASTISKLESTIFKLTIISKELKILKSSFDNFSQSK